MVEKLYGGLTVMLGAIFFAALLGNITAAVQAFVHATARDADAGRANRKDCAAVILYAAEAATRAALDAIQILGGNGYINEYPAGRLLRDAKLYEIGAGTSEIRRMLIGRELFKEGA